MKDKLFLVVLSPIILIAVMLQMVFNLAGCMTVKCWEIYDATGYHKECGKDDCGKTPK